MKNFEEVQKYIVDFAKSKGACNSQLSRAINATSIDHLLSVVKDNLGWVRDHQLFNGVNIQEFFTEEKLIEFGLWNSGADNTGFSNTGDRNTGYSNTGDRNTGDRNTGDRNTGDRNTGDRNTGDWNTGYSNTGDRNTGYSNTGDWNTGDRNTGDRNTGDRNTGDRNTGDWNTGYSNTGDWNTGYSNTGDRNTGDRNTGDRNTGDRNTGDRNTGDWNTGDRNTGYSNTGDRNTGAFCTGEPTIKIFNKESGWTIEQFQASPAFAIMRRIETKMWIPDYRMSEQEKTQFPAFKTAEGYIKDIPIQEAWANLWGNLTDESKQSFKDLPNFSSEIFKQITGIDF